MKARARRSTTLVSQKVPVSSEAGESAESLAREDGDAGLCSAPPTFRFLRNPVNAAITRLSGRMSTKGGARGGHAHILKGHTCSPG